MPKSILWIVAHAGRAMMPPTLAYGEPVRPLERHQETIGQRSISATGIPKAGEVWMCTLGKNLGREQDGGTGDFSRPVLVVKKFNNEIFWIVPLSTKQKPLDFYFNYNDPSGAPVAAVLAQLRLVSINRLRRDIYVLPTALLNEVRVRLRSFLS